MTAPLLSWSVDLHGNLTYVSPSALEFFNKNPLEAHGVKMDALIGTSLNTQQISKMGATTIANNGQRVYVQWAPLYEGVNMIGARMIASLDKEAAPLHRFNRIFSIPYAGWLGTVFASVILCLASMFSHSFILSGVGLSMFVLSGFAVGRWNYIRNSVIEHLCAPKNRLRLQDLSLLPGNLRHDMTVKKCHQTHLLNMMQLTKLQEDVAFQTTFSNILEDNSSPWVVTDHHLTIIRCNQSFAQIMESSPKFLEGQSISGFIPVTTVPFTSISFETEHKDRKYNITVDPKFLEEEACYVSFSLKDVTELRDDEQSLLNFAVSPDNPVNLKCDSTFLDALKYSLEKIHYDNRNFITQVVHCLNMTNETQTVEGMKQELLHAVQKTANQLKEVGHLTELLHSQKLLLKDFIPHQANLLDNLISEVSNSNTHSGALKLKNLDIQKYGEQLATILQSAMAATESQHHNIRCIQNTLMENKHRLDYLHGEHETAALCIDMSLEDRLIQHKTTAALLDVSNSVADIQHNFIQWECEAQEFLKNIEEASKSSLELLTVIADAAHHIEKVVENVESTYDVVDIMCQDQIVHSCIGEYINQGVEDLEATLSQ